MEDKTCKVCGWSGSEWVEKSEPKKNFPLDWDWNFRAEDKYYTKPKPACPNCKHYLK